MKDFNIVEDLTPTQTQQLLRLTQSMWWGKNRTLEEVQTLLKICLSFGLIDNKTENLIGYARVLTDEIKYAFIFDVMIEENYRGKSFGKTLMEKILLHPKLKNITHFELTCVPELTEFYAQFGFKEEYGNVVPMRYSRGSGGV